MSQEHQLCKVTYNQFQDKVEFQAPIIQRQSPGLDDVIEDDKKYGVMYPNNGQYFTFLIIDEHDNEVTKKMLNRAVKYAWKSWTLRLDFDVRQARPGEQPDFRVMIRSPENDERKEMNRSTIMYHYFPIRQVGHPLRGLCVINPNFYYTVDGEPLSLHVIDPDNYPEPTNKKGTTIDLDGVLRHEFGHGIGLPHDPEPNNTMSTPYNVLADFLQSRDIQRGAAKYGRKQISENKLKRFLKWLFHRSENY